MFTVITTVYVRFTYDSHGFLYQGGLNLCDPLFSATRLLAHCRLTRFTEN